MTWKSDVIKENIDKFNYLKTVFESSMAKIKNQNYMWYQKTNYKLEENVCSNSFPQIKGKSPLSRRSYKQKEKTDYWSSSIAKWAKDMNSSQKRKQECFLNTRENIQSHL